MKRASIETAIDAIATGRMVVVVDDEDRENEDDLIMAAQAATEANWTRCNERATRLR